MTKSKVVDVHAPMYSTTANTTYSYTHICHITGEYHLIRQNEKDYKFILDVSNGRRYTVDSGSLTKWPQKVYNE